MLLGDSCTSWNELSAERRNKATSHEYCTAKSITSLRHSHTFNGHIFVKLTQVEKKLIFFFFCSPPKVTVTNWIITPGGSRWEIILILFLSLLLKPPVSKQLKSCFHWPVKSFNAPFALKCGLSSLSSCQKELSASPQTQPLTTLPWGKTQLGNL